MSFPAHEMMTKVWCTAVVLSLAHGAFAQTPDAIDKQQRALSLQAGSLHANFMTAWNLAFPEGEPFATRHRGQERVEAWRPKFDPPPKDVVPLNDGLGCVTFIKKPNTPAIPDICAPVELRAQLVMEALREDWENGRNVPDDKKALRLIRNEIRVLWAEQKTLYCVLRPDAQYIDLNDRLQACTPSERR